ncbi:MAG: sulfite exporter TauE/SafE family protein [Spirochaetia bacterium]
MIGEAFLLGISAGTTCIITCAPIAVPVFLSKERNFTENLGTMGLFLGGRLIGYIIIGFILGMTGAFLRGFVDPAFEAELNAYVNIVIGLVLGLEALLLNAGENKFCRRISRHLPKGLPVIILGLLTGLNLCPPFFAAGARVFTAAPGTGLPGFSGALYFLFFFLGTSLYFLPLAGVPGITKNRGTLILIARMTMALVAVYFLIFIGIFGL